MSKPVKKEDVKKNTETFEDLYEDDENVESDDIENDEDIDNKAITDAEAMKEYGDKVAKMLGYTSLDDAIKAKRDAKLKETGIDDDGYNAVMDVVKSSPEWQEFEAYKQQNKYTKDLLAFNSKHKTSFSAENVTKEVQTIIEGGGLSFEQAMLVKYPKASKISSDNGKKHLKEGHGSGTGGKVGTTNIEDQRKLNIFLMVNPKATEEQRKEFLKNVSNK